MGWFVYIVECSDASLYTGITTDLARRVAAHNSGKGARYTARRTPVHLRYSEISASRSEAASREYQIKQMTRTEKLELIRLYRNEAR